MSTASSQLPPPPAEDEHASGASASAADDTGRGDLSAWFDAERLAAKSAELERATPQEILAFALASFAPRVAISTAFGVEGCALLHMAVQIDPSVRVFTIDTGYLFDETQQLIERMRERLGIEIETFHPELSVAEQDERYGEALYTRDSDACCAMRKVEPTQRALRGLDAWIAGLRRDQGGATRAQLAILERYQRGDAEPLIKVHPLANWNRSDTWRYVLDNEVPYNPLLDQGYKSIGCWPCTRAVGADADERAGRWGGKKAECGIHTFLPRAPESGSADGSAD